MPYSSLLTDLQIVHLLPSWSISTVSGWSGSTFCFCLFILFVSPWGESNSTILSVLWLIDCWLWFSWSWNLRSRVSIILLPRKLLYLVWTLSLVCKWRYDRVSCSILVQLITLPLVLPSFQALIYQISWSRFPKLLCPLSLVWFSTPTLQRQIRYRSISILPVLRYLSLLLSIIIIIILSCITSLSSMPYSSPVKVRSTTLFCSLVLVRIVLVRVIVLNWVAYITCHLHSFVVRPTTSGYLVIVAIHIS